jgi:hypothetical protein
MHLRPRVHSPVTNDFAAQPREARYSLSVDEPQGAPLVDYSGGLASLGASSNPFSVLPASSTNYRRRLPFSGKRSGKIRKRKNTSAGPFLVESRSTPVLFHRELKVIYGVKQVGEVLLSHTPPFGLAFSRRSPASAFQIHREPLAGGGRPARCGVRPAWA